MSDTVTTVDKRKPNIFDKKIMEVMKSDGIIVPVSECFLSKHFSTLTLSNWVLDGRLPAIRIGSRWYTNDDVVSDWIWENQSDITFMSGIRGPKAHADINPEGEDIMVEPEEIL